MNTVFAGLGGRKNVSLVMRSVSLILPEQAVSGKLRSMGRTRYRMNHLVQTNRALDSKGKSQGEQLRSAAGVS